MFLDANAMTQFKKFGYYSSSIKLKNGTEIENTKIIALNLNVCYTMTFVNMKNLLTDPGQ
jgi:hypothetical protein